MNKKIILKYHNNTKLKSKTFRKHLQYFSSILVARLEKNYTREVCMCGEGYERQECTELTKKYNNGEHHCILDKKQYQL